MPAGRKKKIIRHAEIVGRFAERLRELRHEQGLTQAELARAADVSAVYVGRLEGGLAAPGIDLLERLAKALAVEIPDLLPAVASPDTTGHLRERVLGLAQRVAQSSDRDVLRLAAQFLARLADR